MPARKSLLKRIDVESAKHARTCKHSHTKIQSGQMCLVIFDGPRQRFCYSCEIGLKMIEDARLSLNRIETNLLRSREQSQGQRVR